MATAITLSRKLKERLSKKRLIFCATTGRSGTQFLAHAFRSIEGVSASWETDPNFAWVVRPSRTKQGVAKRWWVMQKLPAILACPEPVYLETSHYLTQGALGAALALGIKFDLVVLSRDVRDTAVSFWRRDSIPLQKRDKLWPNDKGNLVPINPDGLTDYQLVYWWVLEMRYRMWHYAEEVRSKGRVVAVANMDGIATAEGFDKLRSTLDLPGPDWDKFPLRPMNASTAGMLALWPEGDLCEQEKEVRRRAKL